MNENIKCKIAKDMFVTSIYDDSEYLKKVKSSSNDIIIEAKYLYKYGNGKINNEPKINGQITLKDFLDSNSGKQYTIL